MQTSELSEIIRSRRSIRRWLDRPVPAELLYQAVEMATHAPNAGNQQNWHFFVILNKEVICAIAEEVRATAEYVASWSATNDPRNVEDMVQRSTFFRNAPALIAVAARAYRSPLDVLAEARPESDQRATDIKLGRALANAKIQSVASATAYMLLALHQMGLGAVWMTGPMQAKAGIEKVLKVPGDMDLVALIPVGYPDEDPPLKERKPISQVCEVIE
jgi:nitroreductase